jgi:ketosteroid isomerase-like protein
MSENLDLATALLARWERGDYDIPEAFHPEIEFTRTGGGAEVLGYGTRSRGIEGLRRAMSAWTDEWEDVRVKAESLTEVGERVVVRVRHRAVGRGSGVAADHVDGWVFSIRDGRIVRWDAYWDPDEALRAAEMHD